MNIHTEHLNIDKNGQLLGLLKIDTDFIEGVDVWQRIERAITTYVQLHPIEMEIVVRENKAISESRLNDYGSTGSKGLANLRWGCNIPVALMFLLERIEPNLFNDIKKYHKFLNKFKGFRVCKKV